MNNDITVLRTHLFDTLRGIKDGSMEIETAKAINDIAQTIINTAKVEVDHMKIVGGCSSFISAAQAGAKIVTKLPGVTVTQHRLMG